MENQDFKIEYNEEFYSHVITFYNDDNGENAIVQSMSTFYKDIQYCEYAGILLELIEECQDYSKYMILPDYSIDIMKNILIKSLDYKIAHTNSHYWSPFETRIATIWKNVFSIWRDDKSPMDDIYDIKNKIEEINPNFIAERRIEPLYYCYLIYDNITDYYKIGRAENPKTRYRTLMSDRNSLELKLVFQCENKKEAIILERALHKHYLSKRGIGEWFDLKEYSIDEIESTFFDVGESKSVYGSTIDIDNF